MNYCLARWSVAVALFTLFEAGAQQAAVAQAFITTWKTKQPTSSDMQITLPIIGSGYYRRGV